MAQTDSARVNHTQRRAFADHDDEILYYGKHDKFFTVRTLLKNGSLFRLDSYTLLPKIMANGIPLDSVSRILRHGPTKIMYLTGQVYISCEYKDDLLNGPFIVLYEDGAVKRREYYRSGRRTQSQCYMPDGTSQLCTPFYQAAQFQGKPSELAAYLKQKLDALLDGERVRRITAALSINEIGQVSNVRVLLNADQLANGQMPDVVSYVQQVMRTMPEWVPDQFNWKPALSDGVAVSSTCIVSVFRTYGTFQYNLFYRL